MINGYEIKKNYNEEILYIYLELDQEFAKLKGKKRKEKLDSIIKDYIKKNNITFKGVTVAIISSGILIGTMMLNKESIDYQNNIDKYTTNIISNNNIMPEFKEIKEDVYIPSNHEIKEETSKIKEQTKKEVKNKVEDKKEEPKVEVKESSTVNNDKYIIIKRNNGLITNIELEEYVLGVVSAEMPASFNEEALKAQAIIARTYAVNTLNKGKILTDDSSTQNYKDNDELKKMWGSNYDKYYNKIKNCVNATKGIYLTYNGTIIDAVYHSTSNGQTEDAVYVWGNSKPYLVSVDSPYDETNKSFNYEKFFSYEEISKKLNMTINEYTLIEVLSLTSSNRVEKIEINNKEFTGIKLRTLLGLRSTDFTLNKEENGISIKTKGYGHGVGLSQYGANGMAKNGSNYEQILKHYYQGVSLTKI